MNKGYVTLGVLVLICLIYVVVVFTSGKEDHSEMDAGIQRIRRYNVLKGRLSKSALLVTKTPPSPGLNSPGQGMLMYIFQFLGGPAGIDNTASYSGFSGSANISGSGAGGGSPLN
jgi:hypothetical protein